MNVIAIARHGIGIAGPPTLGLAIARGIAIDCVRHAPADRLVIQAAGAEAEVAWLARCAARYRPADLPPGLALAVTIGLRTGESERLVGRLLVAEEETDLGERPAAIIRIGPDDLVLDRRDGSQPVPVRPAMIGLAEARSWAREQVGRQRPTV
jgi:hypothetical protein